MTPTTPATSRPPATTPSAAPLVLTSRALSIGYPLSRGQSRTVASDLNLALAPGALTCLLGPNGAGKSTLLRTLAGMQPPLRGELRLGGDLLCELDVRQLARRRAVVLTDQAIVPGLTVRELVALGRQPHTGWFGGLTAADIAVVDRVLALVGGEALAERALSELSDGERQRILIARALAQEPQLLLLDEPTAYLDLPHRVQIMRLLWRLARDTGATILLSTHDLELALRSADILWLMPGDGTLQTGGPEDLALSGALGAAFQGDGLRFDMAQGSFSVRHDHTGFATLSGDGEALGWTRRALERCGYEILAPDDAVRTAAAGVHVTLTTSAAGAAGDTTWLLRRGSVETRLSSLADLAAELRQPPTGG